MSDNTEFQAVNSCEADIKVQEKREEPTLVAEVCAKPYTGELKSPVPYKRDLTFLYNVGRLAGWLYLKLTVGYRLCGQENIPERGAALLVCNHRSFLDPPLLSMVTSQRQIQFMAKQELRTVPVVGFVLRRGCRCIWVDRKARSGKPLKEALEVLRSGRLVGIFPEGTRSKTDKMGTAHAGAALLALETGVPIVPAAVFNTAQALEEKKLFSGQNKPVGVRFGKPFYFDKVEKPLPGQLRVARDTITAKIQELLDLGLPDV